MSYECPFLNGGADSSSKCLRAGVFAGNKALHLPVKCWLPRGSSLVGVSGPLASPPRLWANKPGGRQPGLLRSPYIVGDIRLDVRFNSDTEAPRAAP